ncbi:hypothetical protein GDO86_013686 [Hymenochirus boettgeri]|uniref:Uncharacterized protein n=1 Tax=Hymenochirus boettgeri TaxID=247094 RepID=A0A8T2IV72_9PIPI|nr:hypothetical protein GDO86_013686 [Hymenochirus boettgeri]
MEQVKLCTEQQVLGNWRIAGILILCTIIQPWGTGGLGGSIIAFPIRDRILKVWQSLKNSICLYTAYVIYCSSISDWPVQLFQSNSAMCIPCNVISNNYRVLNITMCS